MIEMFCILILIVLTQLYALSKFTELYTRIRVILLYVNYTLINLDENQSS